MNIFDNASVKGTRQGTTIYASRRVQFEQPTLRERMDAVGALYDARIFDTADATWQQGDTLTLLSLDGFTNLPQITTFRLNSVQHEAGPLEVVEAELVGIAQ